MPLPPWVHGGYFAPARRYGARAALARTQRAGFRSTLHGDRRSVEGECCMVASVEYHGRARGAELLDVTTRLDQPRAGLKVT